MRDIGKNIRDLRQQKHLTQEKLAEQLFVTRQTVSNYENGRTRPDVDQILRLAEILIQTQRCPLWPADARRAKKRSDPSFGRLWADCGHLSAVSVFPAHSPGYPKLPL